MAATLRTSDDNVIHIDPPFLRLTAEDEERKTAEANQWEQGPVFFGRPSSNGCSMDSLFWYFLSLANKPDASTVVNVK